MQKRIHTLPDTVPADFCRMEFRGYEVLPEPRAKAGANFVTVTALLRHLRCDSTRIVARPSSAIRRRRSCDPIN